MIKKRVCVGMALGFIIGLIIMRISFSEELQPNNLSVLNPFFADSSPEIDGNLDDEIWKKSPLAEDFITYNPGYGEVLPQKT